MRDIAQRFRVVYWDSVDEKDKPVAPGFATSWLREWLADPAHRHEVMEAFGLLGPIARRSRGWLDERDLGNFVHPAIERALHTGELVLVERAPIADWKPAVFEVPKEDRPPDSREEKAPTKTWIEFLVEDNDGNPLPDVRYEARLTDDSAKTGKTDSHGLVRFDSLEPGVVEFKLLDFDAEEVEKLTETKAAPAAVKEPLEIELVDDTGEPLGGQKFVVELNAGATKEAKTEDNGSGSVPNLPKGEYAVSFPDLVSA